MPPPQINTSLIHKTCEFYKKIYVLSSKLPKRDKLGIYSKIENICLETLQLITMASLESKISKLPTLHSARTKIELLKRLVRITNELNIITNNKYLELETDLQEISKMINGWIKYLIAAH